MSQQSAGAAPQLYQQDGDQQSHSVESQRLVSEDHSHYILIKGEGSSDAFKSFLVFYRKVVRFLECIKKTELKLTNSSV